MHIRDYDSLAQEQITEKIDNPLIKWRRVRHERRSNDIGAYKEKRKSRDRRTRWLEFFSDFIFPNHSNI